MTAGTAQEVTGSRNSIAYRLLALALCATTYGCATKDHRLEYPTPEEHKELTVPTKSLGNVYEIRFLADKTKPDGVARNDNDEPLISGATGPCYDKGKKKMCEVVFDKGYTFATLKDAKIVNLNGIAIEGFDRAETIFHHYQDIQAQAKQQYEQSLLTGRWSLAPSPEAKAEANKKAADLNMYNAGQDLYNLGGLTPNKSSFVVPQTIIMQATP